MSEFRIVVFAFVGGFFFGVPHGDQGSADFRFGKSIAGTVPHDKVVITHTADMTVEVTCIGFAVMTEGDRVDVFVASIVLAFVEVA